MLHKFMSQNQSLETGMTTNRPVKSTAKYVLEPPFSWQLGLQFLPCLCHCTGWLCRSNVSCSARRFGMHLKPCQCDLNHTF